MISNNLSELVLRIKSACQRSGREAEEITIVAVSKLANVEEIKEALEAGIINIGENRVQDALLKFDAIRPPQNVGGRPQKSCGGRTSPIRWHMVGHLQTNKVKEAVKVFDLIHSVDSERIAFEIDKQAAKINKIQGILIEVNVAQEKTKFGLNPQEAVAVIKKIAQLKNLKLKGLMAIAPQVFDHEKARPFFRQLRQLRDKLNELRVTSYELRDLSMGMTDDFEAAIEEGSTIVRIGRAIFKG